MSQNQIVYISADAQEMRCFEDGELYRVYPVSTAKNGLGEKMGSQCTPRGWHAVYSHIGMNAETNSVFVSRQWTGELYSDELAAAHPDRDWILTRILQLDGLEPGFNKGGDVDSLQRYIYIHGTPDSTDMSIPGSHGCIRMRNKDVIEFAKWVLDGTRVHID
ncbi:L,D-transpeptidase family protein [Legionella sp. CNM-4043-24]|uniref:L,D-transpeptidase family protein n=1 Tax=Legionella sp. CNM-4043-24 TaxID=3421646 RepID=UPI00403ADA27